ncbi:MAG: GGDEF domain-containing response regulator [Vulcanimicrobiaceae bacterium]
MIAAASPKIEKSREPAIRVLIIDDNPRDAELSLMQLRRAGMSVEGVNALDRQQLREALRTFVPDVVLCDFSFPDFDGYAALRIVREVLPHVPLIFVTGTITENRAISAVQSGAADFVLKSNLTRLPSVVQRAVREAREKKRLESTLENSEGRARRQASRLESLWRIASNPGLQGASLIPAILCEAAEAIRPNQCFRGVLSRIEAATAVVIGLGVAPRDSDPRIMLPQLGSTAPIRDTLVPIVGRSQAWDNLDSMAIPVGIARLGWRCGISTRFEAAGVRYLLTFASPEPTTITFGAEDISYLEILGASFAHFLQLNHVTDQLREAEEHSRQHAERLESLWRLVNEAGQGEAQLWPAMLAQAATEMQPGHPYRGTLWRIDGADMVVEGSSEEAPGHSPSDSKSRLGRSIPMATSIVGKFLADGGGTQSWENLPDDAESSSAESHECSVVVTTFSAGNATWALKFSSSTPAERPFGVEEHAYIEVLASYFASHIQDRWHSEQLQYHRSHDALTNLLSRSQFRSLAQSASRTNGSFAVVLIDIDAFSEINESYGHVFGDAVLVEIGRALLERVSEGEILARIAGDVFAIFIPCPLSVEFMQNRSDIFASIFSHGISTPGSPGGMGPEMVSRTASIGVAMAPKDGSTVDAILTHADAALLNAKMRGDGSTVFFEEEMGGDAARRTTLRNELATAIVDNQFTLYFQPHVEIATGVVTGCEALIRWNHPERGLLLPGHFIPFAEQSGIITSIDAWVLRNACAVSAELAALRDGFRTYFNLSGRQAGDPKLIRALKDEARSGVVLSNIGVEITESDAMRDVEATRRVCRALRRLDVRIAIDDFGTGYSSLSFLKRLPVDIVKIDRSFISGVLTDPHDETIAETIISISERFGFESLAEGAEQVEEIEWLRKRSCRFVQGYAICHPLPLEAFKSWLHARSSNGQG